MQAVSLKNVRASRQKPSPLRAVALLLVALTSVYALFMPCNTALYDVLLFPLPDPRTPDISKELEALRTAGIATEEVTFATGNGNVLHGLLYKRTGSNRVFLFSHGRGNNIYVGGLPKARQYLACGGSVFIYDYQGYGRSQGRPSVEKACDDGLAAYDYLIEHEHYSPDQIIGVGESLGSGITMWLSERRSFAAIIIHSGFSSLKQAAIDKMPLLSLYANQLSKFQTLDNIKVLRRIHPPLLIIHGNADTTIGAHHAKALYQQAIEPKQLLMLEGGHCTFGPDQTFVLTVRDFIARNHL